MNRMIRTVSFLCLAVAGALLIMVSAGEENQETCCFTHPNYSGTCEVAPGEGETCQSVLQYLNTPMSQGKTYCGGSELRGSWELVSCIDR